jgi:hypothetical protein
MADDETCEKSPDGAHCRHWYDGDPCHHCGAPALSRARYAGFWSRFDCEACGDAFEIEGDVSNGETLTCDACGADCIVEGR